MFGVLIVVTSCIQLFMTVFLMHTSNPSKIFWLMMIPMGDAHAGTGWNSFGCVLVQGQPAECSYAKPKCLCFCICR